MTALLGLDEALLLIFNHPAGRIPLVDKLVFDIADSVFLKGGAFLALYWALWFKPGARLEENRRDLATALICAAFVAILSRLLQVGLPFHQRPLHTPGLAFRIPFEVSPETLNNWSSFPSDHAVLFFALCVPLWRRSRWLGLAMGGWTLAVICLPRLYLGYHYPSDVVAGGAIGIVLMLILLRALGRTRLPGWLVALERRRPHIFYGAAFLASLELAVLFYDLRHIGLDAVRILKSMIA
jgi:undecaprenyl-diphosphatase